MRDSKRLRLLTDAIKKIDKITGIRILNRDSSFIDFPFPAYIHSGKNNTVEITFDESPAVCTLNVQDIEWVRTKSNYVKISLNDKNYKAIFLYTTDYHLIENFNRSFNDD